MPNELWQGTHKMGKDEVVPKDLGVKIGSKAEANWTSILKQSEELITQGEANLEINKLIVERAKQRIAEEKENFK